MAAADSTVACKPDDGDRDRVVYIQDGVFVHTAVPITTRSASIIPGKVSIIEKENNSFVDWSPSEYDDEDHFELQSSDYSEWNLVTQSKQEDGNVQQKGKKSKYAINFNTADLHSIRRSDPKLTWSYAVFILKDGTTLPALHFHTGGISEMIRRLQRYIWLVKAPHNNKLFVVAEDHNALKKSIDQLQLFSDGNSPATAPWQRFINSAYYDGMGALSKVTRYVRDVYEGLQQGTEDTNGASPGVSQGDVPGEAIKKDAEFEDLGNSTGDNYVCPNKRDLGEVAEVTRCEPLKLLEWQSFFDEVGRVTDVKKLLDRIFRGGVHDSIRKSVWQYILGYKKYGRTSQSQQSACTTRREEYQTMKWQWQSMTAVQQKNFSEFREKKHLIEKDVARTDRRNPFYSETNYTNIEKMYNILLTYCMYNFDLGYVQGMSDLLSPILFVMENEEEAFWCFVGLMEKVAHNFDENQEGMKAQLHQLTVLLGFIDPHFYSYLEKHESGNMYFCFRWLLICFKREFSFPDIMMLWETLWSQRLSPNYHLIICLAILDQHRQVIMENGFGFNEILKYINDLAYNINIQEVLIKAELLCLQLMAFPELPVEVRAILTGRNEAMMTPNVERQDPFLMDHSRHVARLLDLNTYTQSNPSDRNGESSKENDSKTNDLNTVTVNSQEKESRRCVEELPLNVEEPSSEDEIVVLSEEVENVF